MHIDRVHYVKYDMSMASYPAVCTIEFRHVKCIGDVSSKAAQLAAAVRGAWAEV